MIAVQTMNSSIVVSICCNICPVIWTTIFFVRNEFYAHARACRYTTVVVVNLPFDCALCLSEFFDALQRSCTFDFK